MAMVFPASPTVGQVFTSGGRSWVWNGSAWDAPSATNVLQVPIGLVHLATATNTNTTGLIISNVFSSTYNNYKIVLTGFGSANSQRLFARLRSGASDFSGTHTNGTAGFDQSELTTTSYRTRSMDSLDLGFISPGSGAPNIYSFDLSNPFLATPKAYIGNGVGQNGGIVNLITLLGGFIPGDGASRDGINFFSASNWTGTVRIYGYRNL